MSKWLKSMLNVVIGSTIVGAGAGVAMGLSAPIEPVSALSGCTCTMPALGSWRCPDPHSQTCNSGGWTCNVICD